MSFKVPNKFRVRTGAMASSEENGNNGMFVVTLRNNQKVKVIASDGLGLGTCERKPTRQNAHLGRNVSSKGAFLGRHGLCNSVPPCQERLRKYP